MQIKIKLQDNSPAICLIVGRRIPVREIPGSDGPVKVVVIKPN